MRQLHASLAIIVQTFPMSEDQHKFPLPNPENSFFEDRFWPHGFAHHQINNPGFTCARKSIRYLPLIQIQERGEWRQEQ